MEREEFDRINVFGYNIIEFANSKLIVIEK